MTAERNDPEGPENPDGERKSKLQFRKLGFEAGNGCSTLRLPALWATKDEERSWRSNGPDGEFGMTSKK